MLNMFHTIHYTVIQKSEAADTKQLLVTEPPRLGVPPRACLRRKVMGYTLR